MKKRIIIGVILLILAIILSFVIAPLIQKWSSGNIKVIRCKKDIDSFSLIKEEDIEEVYIGKYNLSDNIIKNKEQIIGKYALSKIYSGDYFTQDKLSENSKDSENVFSSLNGEERAYSVNISSISQGVGNTLGYGDIVSIVCNQNGNAFIPQDLKYLKVISLKNSRGQNYEDNPENGIYTCITFELNEDQCLALSEYVQKYNISLILVCKYQSSTYKNLGF